MPTTPTMSDSRVLLTGISWETYERLLDELSHRRLRLTYDRGDLEIMAPSFRHEHWKTLLGRAVEAMTAELDLEIKSGGSTTLERRDLEKGLEPDECYWVQHEPAVRDKLEIDLLIDPPPDLVIESEASRSLLDRLAVLAALGVGEAWRFDGDRLTVLVLGEDGSYAEQSSSRCFPWLPIAEFAARVKGAEGAGETAWIRALVAWTRTLRT